MSSTGVRGRIASYEAQTGKSIPTRQASSPARNNAATIKNEPSPARPSPSLKAAQNRKSRIRQENMTKEDTTESMSAEKQTDKRRMQKEPPGTSQEYASSVSLPRRTEYEDVAANAQEPKIQKESPSPSRATSRLSKMQRMQRMLGYDSSKKNKASRQSIAETSTVSAATTEVVKNNSNPVQPRRQRQTLMQSRAKRHSAINYKHRPTTPDQAKRHLTSPRPQTGHAAVTSPTSDADTAFGTVDQSMDPNTDDEATLTSVRQIMNGDNHEVSPRKGQSYHYQNLQNFQDSTRAKRSGQSTSLGERTNNFSSTSATSQSRKERRKKNNGRWPQEEKSDKGRGNQLLRSTSSSDYDTDGDVSKQSNALEGPTNSQLSDVNEFFTQQPRYNPQRRMVDDDENTFDYGDRDDESNASASFALRQRRMLAEQQPPKPSNSKEKKESKSAPSSLLNKEDVEHYTKSLGSSTVRMGAGVLAGVTIGCVVLGPTALLAGAALVGLGVGAMQIPEEERQKIQGKLQETAHQVHEKAIDATEKLSNSCAASYEESGVAEHLPPCLSIPGPENGEAKEQASIETNEQPTQRREALAPNKSGPKVAGPAPPPEPRVEPKLSSMDRARNKKVACLRNVRILPAGQIHGLDPSAQPKAWLDVVASANTSEDEKMEALEEILILAKDKRRAQILLDEGILDSLVWNLDRYIEKVHSANINDWLNAMITPNERRAAKLSASCCVTLGKTHCAATHTEGDLQLMSLYERGSVPEERQVAQMLHEIPHHVRITKLEDPTVVIPKKEVLVCAN